MIGSCLGRVAVCPVRRPLRRPFVTALGRKIHSDNVLVCVGLKDGAAGWGEASSPLAMRWQTGPFMVRSHRRLAGRFRGRDVRGVEKLVRDVWALVE